MAKAKQDHEYTDAKGDVHKVFADGRTEIYHKGPHDKDQNFMEITDETDQSVNRRRFMPWTQTKVEETLQVRSDDPEDNAMPGVDFDDVEVIDDAED